MNSFRVVGGAQLHGTLRASGNKNAALPLIAAALLAEEPVTLRNVPDIGDVRTMLDLVASAGVVLEWDRDAGTLIIDGGSLCRADLPGELYSRIRAGILLAAPLLHRFGRVRMPPPGGDVIGRRRLDSHFYGLSALGAEIDVSGPFEFCIPSGFRGGDLFLPEASVTATSQVLMAAACADGVTTIRNAACEPHVQDVARLLCAMGAAVDGIGSNTMTVRGTSRFGGAEFRVSSDYTEVGSFLALAAATGGSLTVTDVDADHYRMIPRTFEQLGIRLDIGDDRIVLSGDQSRRIVPELSGGIPVVDDGIWPQFPSDLMSVAIVLATQLSGTVLFFEKLYESRMYFVDRLVDMGANAVICDPHRVVIAGPSRLHGITLNSPDIRAGIALLGAALCARGESVIHHVNLIDRGYERVDERLRQIGACIERV
jgi:UDP-N-acetylglucosamine 1-carboxyvinyltransferase